MDLLLLRSWMQKQVSLLAYEKTGTTLLAPSVCQTALTFGQLNASKNRVQCSEILLYYDVDSAEELNQEKQAYIERIGSECVAEEIPFFLEILAYDEKIADAGSVEYAKVKTS